MRITRRRGFTLVELLFSCAVMVAVAYGLYHLYRATNRHASQVAWTSEAQRELRQALKRSHDELTKASYWTEVKPSIINPLTTSGTVCSGSELDCKDDYFIRLEGGTSEGTSLICTYTAGTGTQQMLSWYQAVPRQTSGTPVPGSLGLCALVMDGSTLTFARTVAAEDQSGLVQAITVALAHNVVEVTVKLSPKEDAADALEGCTATVIARVHHPNVGVFPNARIRQEITCRVPVRYQGQP